MIGFMTLSPEIRSAIFDFFFTSVVVRQIDREKVKTEQESSHDGDAYNRNDPDPPILAYQKAGKQFSEEARFHSFRHATFNLRNSWTMGSPIQAHWKPDFIQIRKVILDCSHRDLETILNHLENTGSLSNLPLLKHLRLNVNCWLGDPRTLKKLLHRTWSVKLELAIALRFSLPKEPSRSVFIDSDKAVTLFHRRAIENSTEYLRDRLGWQLKVDKSTIMLVEDDHMAISAIEVFSHTPIRP